ncbi:MAG: aminopeptidase [Gammaproteobacteria bacterium]|nr:aminopeptidase [Gammaproteobacteria bacterium]MBT6043804.1 aminopeptidase [Gammaproteobacteria bacterium]
MVFYGQAINGQLSIISKRENIQTLVNDPEIDAQLKQSLESIISIRKFANNSLALPVEKNYSSYVDLQRPFVLWNVFAAPEFSVTPKDWCYPIAGCVSYRGYFSEDAARKYATSLADEGFDVYVGGIAAYSTLGWFADPVLNTIINREEHRLAALLFHELAHQLVYVPGDTQFNESFATTIELEGLKRWLAENNNSAMMPTLVEQAAREQQYRQEFVSLVQSSIPVLEELYSGALPLVEKRQQKAKVIQKLRDDYQDLKQQWSGYAAYDGWFAGEINNARLNTVATYFNHVPAFEALLAQSNYQLPEFYNRVQALAKLSSEERQEVLTRLTP